MQWKWGTSRLARVQSHHDGQVPMSILEKLRALFTSGTAADAGGSSCTDGISCEEALRVVQEFLDGELEPSTEDRVKAHFDKCVRCYPHLDFENAYREAVCRAVRGETAPPELRAKVAALIAEADTEA